MRRLIVHPRDPGENSEMNSRITVAERTGESREDKVRSEESFSNKVKTLFKQPLFLTVQALLGKIPFRPVQIGRFYILHLDQNPRAAAPRIRGRGEVRKGTPDDIEGLVRCQDKRDVFMRRFTLGDYCLVAIANGRIVGYEWFCMRSQHIEERYQYKVAMPPHSIYAYDAYILPQYRLTGIWVKFKEYLAELMNELGKRVVITMIDYGNEASIRTHIRYGFRRVKSIFYLNILGLRIFREMETD